VLFIHLKRDPVFEITIPSKTYGYLAAAKPILAAAEWELAELISGLGAGVVCPPEDAAALAGAVRRLDAMTESERAALGQAGHRAVTMEYSRDVLGKRYVDLFDKVTQVKGKRPKYV
jgi:colanic acid biosynthesis glycosyl transferase WcaI